MKTSVLIIAFIFIIFQNNAQQPFIPLENENSTINGNNEFSIDLYSKLCKNKENIFFSPFSISSALAMTYAGAKGETAKQMSQVLHYHLKPDNVQNDFSILLNDLKKRNKEKIKLNIANSLWAQKDYYFLDDYFNSIKKYYGAGLQFVDFKDDAEREKSRILINEWVEKETNNKIKDILFPGALIPTTRLVLVNAIYFYGNWANQFHKELTKNDKFYINTEKTVNSLFMNQQSEFKYFETELLKGIELPYAGNEISMLVLLPKAKDGLQELENSFTYKNYRNWNSMLTKKEVKLSIPKFEMTSEFNLGSVLSGMGMPDAFSFNADFSGMTGKKDLKIDKVVHKAFVEVNEKGTEAAAATAVMMMEKAAPIHKKIKIFKADHPFIFIIKDNLNGSILFIGRVLDPSNMDEKE
ncbi:MAG: serpin family protein [Bacteroidales bacterium]|nr:serpin family protein [Bacteroidales bacterium]